MIDPTHQNPASLEIPIDVEGSLHVSKAFTLDDIPERRIHHSRAITRTKIKKAEMLLSAFFSHFFASIFGLALSFQAFLQEKLALSAFLQDSGLLYCRFESTG